MNKEKAVNVRSLMYVMHKCFALASEGRGDAASGLELKSARVGSYLI